MLAEGRYSVPQHLHKSSEEITPFPNLKRVMNTLETGGSDGFVDRLVDHLLRCVDLVFLAGDVDHVDLLLLFDQDLRFRKLANFGPRKWNVGPRQRIYLIP